MIDTVATTSPFALTGAVFSEDEDFVKEASNRLRSTCGELIGYAINTVLDKHQESKRCNTYRLLIPLGNFYINDKSTGSVVGQQPFGGARLSGTNDKAGQLPLPCFCLFLQSWHCVTKGGIIDYYCTIIILLL